MGQTVAIRAYEGQRPGIILVGVPTFGAVSIEWHGHLMQLQTPMNRALRHLYVKGKEVGDARNEIVEHALNFQGTLGERVQAVLFIDDDVLVPPDTVARLLAHKRPIVSGLYYAKTVARQPLMLADRFGGLIETWEPNSVVECYAHGMGCTLISREVFEAVERPWFKTIREAATLRDGVPVSYHQTEDVHFLEKARDKGFQPAVDTSLFAFHYSMVDRVGYPIQEWQAATTVKSQVA